jgi:hypothetical protein
VGVDVCAVLSDNGTVLQIPTQRSQRKGIATLTATEAERGGRMMMTETDGGVEVIPLQAFPNRCLIHYYCYFFESLLIIAWIHVGAVRDILFCAMLCIPTGTYTVSILLLHPRRLSQNDEQSKSRLSWPIMAMRF